MLKKQGIWQQFKGIEEPAEVVETADLEESAAEETAELEGTEEPVVEDLETESED